MRQFRIFVADPDRDALLGLQMLFDYEPGMRVVGIAVPSVGLVGQVGAAQPDVLILDWQLVASAPVEFIRNLRSVESQPYIIVTHIHPETGRKAAATGADAFFCKDSPPDPLMMILHKLRRKRLQEQETILLPSLNSLPCNQHM